MLNFNNYDKITLIANTVFNFNHDFNFEENIDSQGERLHLKHEQVGLNVFINYQKSTTMITFSSKVLKKNVLDLVSIKTIQVVYEVISGIIDISHEEFLQCTVLKAEVTKDTCYVKPEELIESLFKLAQLQTAYKTPRRFFKSSGKACSFWMKKDNTNKKYIDYLSIYDKKAEFLKKEIKANQEILQSLSHEELQEFLKALEDKVRFEVKLNSAYMIRKHLELEEKTTPTLGILLNSEVPVVKNMVEKIFRKAVDLKGKEYKPKNMTQLSYYLALKENGFNVEKTIAYLKHLLGDVKRSRVAKKLGEVAVSVTLMHYTELVTVYNKVMDLL